MNLYRYVGNNPVRWRDPFGLVPGDIFLYTTDQSFLSNTIAHATGGPFSHSSIELENSLHFTTTIAGATFQNLSQVFTQGGPREIHIFRPQFLSSTFDTETATEFANRIVKWPLNYYGVNGVCSSNVALCAIAGGTGLRSKYPSPNGLSHDPALTHVGVYDTKQKICTTP